MRAPPVIEQVDDAYATERVSPELTPLLHAVYAEVQRTETSAPALYCALEALLTFLALPPGRTHANCVAADDFFMRNDRWERDWEHLPEPFQDLLGDLGGALHDTISATSGAENFDSTPEALLAQLRRIEVRAPSNEALRPTERPASG
jgi:hypothetical protein